MRNEPARLGGISLDFAGGIDFSLKRMRMFWNSFQIRFQNGYDEYYQIVKSKI